MRVVVAGSAGHLGEGLMRRFAELGAPFEAVGVDLKPSPFTHRVGSIVDRDFVDAAVDGADAVLNAATLHKPHVATHARSDFVDVNVAGTLNLLEAAVATGAKTFVFTSTTSAFGASLNPAAGEPAAWIDETAPAVPKNIYGVTKTAAEDLCHLFHRRFGLDCVVLRTSRFFPEEDDDRSTRDSFSDENSKANEYLHRRVDLGDAVEAHLLAIERAPEIGFGRYIVSATTPFDRDDLAAIAQNAPEAVARRFPAFEEIYRRCGYRMFATLDRVYSNAKARADLGWRPVYDFARILEQLAAEEPIGGDLARAVGAKGYHDRVFQDGPFPVE